VRSIGPRVNDGYASFLLTQEMNGAFGYSTPQFPTSKKGPDYGSPLSTRTPYQEASCSPAAELRRQAKLTNDYAEPSSRDS
jgi:hypothetical protein